MSSMCCTSKTVLALRNWLPGFALATQAATTCCPTSSRTTIVILGRIWGREQGSRQQPYPSLP
ncbi:hypothetical protein SODALDRAFT_364264 [Sodiomyces alkalinus F11]|uniref:Secreted protein n=1 Tax=Sodiomyces alkalinus (strain CBS 110278 / VKM F-3762 / F11) TaxID=1314773 RepID=A0A3N2PJQ1_SODAK|nr:hypothetical protein SODALDRAFT_364264 [Sodiomyces alkalinus F11]ROT34751.1 hypothetical protein SODALDRAFT_364264 [Sodiomyces alkalinus F11]